jgi:galactoside O-acetyltransferase
LKNTIPKLFLLRFRKYVKVEPSSILLLGTCVRLDKRSQLENRSYIDIGSRCIIKSRFIFETESGYVKIGNNVHIGGATFICRESIEVENDVTMAWGITVYDHNSHSVYWDERCHDNTQCYDDYLEFNGNNLVNKNWKVVKSAPIKICSKAWIGFDVLILKGVTIGEGAVVGAKSVVTKDVPPYTVVAGNPAIVVKDLKTKGI